MAQYYTPNSNEVHKVGITPDIEATLPEGDTTMYDIGDLSDAQLKDVYKRQFPACPAFWACSRPRRI